MTSTLDSRVYVGNLPPDVREKEVKALFWKFGPIKHITLKNQRGPPFAFVEFNDYRDAEDAVRGRTGYNFDGYKLRVERPKSNSIINSKILHSPGQTIRGGVSSKGIKHRVKVTGLPLSGSWQDLKDHMREAGDVCYADVFGNGTGVVEYLQKDDALYAIHHLDDTKFRSHEGETAYIRVKADNERSRSRSPGRSPSCSNPSDRSKSNSRSRSPRN